MSEHGPDVHFNYFKLLEQLEPDQQKELEAVTRSISFPAHHVIYEQGTEADAVYIIESGVFEVVTKSPDGKQSRSVAVMNRGQFFGDLGVLTHQPRIATVRTCEPATVLRMDKISFMLLLDKMPRFASYFAHTLAVRLYATTMEAHRSVYAVDLSGNLEHFDLLTIFQAITGANRTGELYLKDSDNNVIGSFFFRDGRVEHARFVHLDGIEAVWQGFVESATAGTFHFSLHPDPVLPYVSSQIINLNSTDLLMQGVGRRDTYQALPADLRQMKGRLCHRAEALQWINDENKVLAARIWELTARRPQPLDSLWRRLNYSALTFLETIDEMVKAGQAELLPA